MTQQKWPRPCDLIDAYINFAKVIENSELQNRRRKTCALYNLCRRKSIAPFNNWYIYLNNFD